MRGKILKNILFLASLIAILHYIALRFYFYWSVPWYDIPMHIGGGVLIASIFIWLVFFSAYHPFNISKNSKNIYRVAFWSVIIVGFAWEIFELGAGLTKYSLADTIDSVKDILDDVLGALITGWYFVAKRLIHQNNGRS